MADLGGIVLAAGAGRRMGRPKALVEWGGESFLGRIARVLAGAPDVANVCVVVGAAADEVRKTVPLPAGVEVVENPGWDAGGMISSIQVGLAALRGGGHAGDGVVLWPVDHPAVRPETVAHLVASFRSLRPAVAIPAHEGRHGHPVIFGPKTYGELEAAGAGGARGVGEKHSRLVVPVDDPGIRLGVDRPADLEALA